MAVGVAADWLVDGATAAAAWADRRVRGRPGAGRAVLAGAGRELAAAVRSSDLERARRLAPTLVGRDPAGLGPADNRRLVDALGVALAGR